MDKRVKKKDRENTNTIDGSKIDSTTNNSNNDSTIVAKTNIRRPLPMTPKAGVTLKRRRYNFGGKYGR